MAHEIKTEIVINSTPENIWKELMNFEAFPEWNPFIKSIAVVNEFQIGGKLKVLLHILNRKPQKFSPKVITLDPHREFSWLGNLFIPKIFDGHHFFQLEQLGHQTKFIQKERFSGLLSFAIKFIAKDTLDSFNAMNEVLKERVESRGL